MKISRQWCMSNSLTFKIKPIKKLIERYHDPSKKWLDPFCRTNPFKSITNDLDPSIASDYSLESLDFLKLFDDCSADGVFFDPPYSPRQIKECYNGIGLKVLQSDTQSSWWSNRKNEVARVLDVGGICISCGWNTNALGS